MQDYIFTKLNKKEFETLVQWADDEGWNPGPGDAEVYWNTDPDGYYGFFKDNELIAGGSVVSYNSEFGFMGFFIVKPEYRGKGIGTELWYLRRNKLLSRLNKNATIGMDGVVDMQPFYQKGGFEIAFRDERYEIMGRKTKYSSNIHKVQKNDYEQILEFDKKCFGYKRPQFLIPWMEVKDTKSFKYSINNELKGFVVVRKANKGYKIGPLFAESFDIADELLKKCLDTIGNDNLFLDIPVINENAKKLIDKYNGKYVFECARMYYGKPPDVDINNIFGITTFELG